MRNCVESLDVQFALYETKQKYTLSTGVYFEFLTWLGDWFRNITISKESEPNVKEIRRLLDEDTKEEQL